MLADEVADRPSLSGPFKAERASSPLSLFFLEAATLCFDLLLPATAWRFWGLHPQAATVWRTDMTPLGLGSIGMLSIVVVLKTCFQS